MRVMAMMRRHDSLARTLAAAGWHVHDMAFARMSAVGEFSDLAAARVAAARDLPPGVLVRHSGGGFVVGHEDVELASGELLPAYVLWPDGEERLVEAREQLAGALRERLDWLCDRAREMALDDVERGRETALGAIDALDLGGELTNQALGPVFHAGCSASVEPVGRLWVDGFAHGWERPDGRPAAERRHPIHYAFDGAFTNVWRDGFVAGAEAARERLTAAQRAVLPPEPTEQELRDRSIDDPDVRARRGELHAEVVRRVREVKHLCDGGEAVAARAALAEMQRQLAEAIREYEADETPAATKAAASLRRIASATDRLAEELPREQPL